MIHLFPAEISSEIGTCADINVLHSQHLRCHGRRLHHRSYHRHRHPCATTAISAATSAPQGGAVCHPYAAGVIECGMLPGVPTPRSSEPWRTYSELLYSGALDAAVTREILNYHQTQQALTTDYSYSYSYS